MKTIKKPLTEAQKVSLIPYLHGDVSDDEFEAACCYEYARESQVLREAAARWSKEHNEMVFADELQEFECPWFVNGVWPFIYRCPAFPSKTWNELKAKERAAILCGFPLAVTEIRPLRMTQVWNLDANGIFDEFKALAAKQRQAMKSLIPTASCNVYPIVEGWPKQKQQASPWLHALFTMDLRKTPDRLKQEFGQWLNRPDIQKRRKQYQLPPERTDAFRDQLKALAAWRLRDAFNDWGDAAAFADDNRLTFARSQKVGGISYKAGEPRPFHNPGRKRSGERRANVGWLFQDEAAYRKSIRNAEQWRAKWLPWEFSPRRRFRLKK